MDNIKSLIKDLTKSKWIWKIVLAEDYENYLYEKDLNISLRVWDAFGLRNLENFKSMRTLNKENFENLLTILNRFMGKSELSWNENKNIEELNNDKNKAF